MKKSILILICFIAFINLNKVYAFQNKFDESFGINETVATDFKNSVLFFRERVEDFMNTYHNLIEIVDKKKKLTKEETKELDKKLFCKIRMFNPKAFFLFRENRIKLIKEIDKKINNIKKL